MSCLDDRADRAIQCPSTPQTIVLILHHRRSVREPTLSDADLPAQPARQHPGYQVGHGMARLAPLQHPPYRGGVRPDMPARLSTRQYHGPSQPGMADRRLLHQCPQRAITSHRRTLLTHDAPGSLLAGTRSPPIMATPQTPRKAMT
jgi:hypothetical protein